MSIVFLGSSNVSNGLAQGTSAVVPKPGGVVDGDFLLAFISLGNTGTVVAPAGWTEVVLAVNTAPNLQNRIYWRLASSEPATWTWTFPSAAYVGIVHATRGVSHVFAANQSDDGLSLLAHTTPVIAAPANAWLVSSWTGRNLLALGWAPPAGDTERQDVIGGLLILLNINHAVDDTSAPVVAGNYSKTTNTLLSVRALSGLVALAPTLSPLLPTALDLKAPIAQPVMSRTMLPTALDLKAPFATATLGVGVLPSALDLKAPVGAAVLNRAILADIIDLKSLVGDPIMGPAGLVWTPVNAVHLQVTAELIAGEVFLDAPPVVTFSDLASATITPGQVTIQGTPLPLIDGISEAEIIPGEVTLFPQSLNLSHLFSNAEQILLGDLISNESPIDTQALFGTTVFGLQIGSAVTPFVIPPINTVNGYEKFADAQIFPVYPYGGVCC